ncbi:putative pentatricopeptide repeat-containing protein [Sesamum alatum]|uniref:Pentatricopeptide repeat-containing protein n=1 Tax=Sesamum alatum TaxID=300844 RepID=A0AAE2C8T8_9LAMI|nr:putative pentatricopeptide repeat-containing protein [Sesamum alatum]
MILLPFLHKRFYPTLPRFSTPYSYIYARCYFHCSKSNQFQSIRAHPNDGFIDFFDCLLQRCASGINESLNLDRPVKQIHTQVILTCSLSSAFLSARLISVYAKLSLLDDARKVFDTSPEDCFFSSLFWNSMLRAYVSGLNYGNAVELYRQMRELNVQPDGFGFPLIIRACAMRGDVRLCKIVHCHVVQMGFANNMHVSNELMGMYGEIGRTEVALQVFDRMPLRSRVSWNVMVSGYAKNYDSDGAFAMLCRMENEGWDPNSVTWTSLISSFARCGLGEKTWEFFVLMKRKGVDATAESIAVVISVCTEMPNKGEIVHGHVITAGFEKYIFVRNALISMYGRNGAIGKVEYLFSGLESQNIVSWNSLISAYAQSGLCDEAFSAFMRLESLNNNLTVSPNVVSWTAVINGFAASGQHNETLDLFRRMQFAQVPANAVTVAGVLSVSAELSALPLGREIHAHAIRVLMDSDMLVTNGLINMYMKCGSLMTGHSIFERMVYRDITSWNIIITGYGMHGLGDRALKIFHQMVNAGVKPDEVTFVAVLSACSHSGLITEGHLLFHQMTQAFQIAPQVEHYACMVDLFGRAGLLQEASNILKSMPMEPNAPVWGALLNSCKMHKNTDVAGATASQIFNLNSEATGSYMLLSNLYAANGRWDDSAKVRISARTRGLRKIPGQSWIEVKKKFHSFSAGKALTSEMEQVHGVLKELNLQMVMESHAFFEPC